MKNKHIKKTLRILLSLVATYGWHVFALSVGFGVYFACSHWLKSTTSAADLDSSIQLLTQVLAVSVTIMLVGITVYSSSYDISDAIDEFSNRTEKAIAPFFDLFFQQGKTAKKFRTMSFRRLLQILPVDLQLYEEKEEGREQLFIFRWDGVWYWTHESPFSKLEDQSLLGLVGAYHELAIMARQSLVLVRRLRENRLNLVSEKSGSNGSTWFLERLKGSHVANQNTLPTTMPPSDANELIFHAFAAQHYMSEEFGERRAQRDWTPVEVTHFYLIYTDYLIALTQFIEKVQKVRMFRILGRFPEAEAELTTEYSKKFKLDLIYKCRSKLLNVKKRINSVHGVARYFSSLRYASIPGIGTAVLALFLILLCWPFAKLSMSELIRFQSFCVLYGLGIAALFESALFLRRILRDKRSASRWTLKS